MKVKAINKNTNQEIDCEEVEIDGYKYYLYYNTEPKKIGHYYITKDNQVDIVKTGKELGKPILCSNNPNIDIPKISKVDDVETRAMELLKNRWSHLYIFGNPKRPFPTNYENDLNNIKLGILESNRDAALSSDDTIDFCNWFCDVFLNKLIGLEGVEEEEKYAHLKGKGANEEVLQIWKEQRAKVVYVQ